MGTLKKFDEMKILIIGYKLPFPGKDGGEYALRNFVSGLLATDQCEIHYLTLGNDSVSKDNLPPELQKLSSFKVVKSDTAVSFWGIIQSFFSSRSYFISRFDRKEMHEEIKRILSQNAFDVIHLEHICLTHYIHTIRKNENTKITLRTQNIEYFRWKSILKLTKNPLKYFYLNLQAKKLERDEKYSWNRPDAIIALTNEDGDEIRKHLKKGIPVEVIPIGYDFQIPHEIPSKKMDGILRFYFIGSMDWIPNLQGVDWFLKELYPEIAKQENDIQFHFAGKNMPQRFKKMELKNVFFHGEVENASDFIRNKDILFVPLRSGGGMKIKIMEALANSKPVLAYFSALNGFDKKQPFLFPFLGSDELLDSMEKFREIYFTIPELGRTASDFAFQNFNNLILAKQTLKFYKSII